MKKRKSLVAIIVALCILISSLSSMLIGAQNSVENIFLEAESMNTNNHVIAEKTATSVKATYSNGIGDDWLAHGGYVNYTITEDECLYVRARTLGAISDSTRQFSVRYTYRLGAGAAQEYFFHFAGDTFSTVDEYIDIPLYNPDLIGAVVSEIVLFGNAADRDPFEIDCFILDDIPSRPVSEVFLEAESMNTNNHVIAEKTATSVKATYSNGIGDDWLAHGGYVNYTITEDKCLYIRARTLGAISDSTRQFSVRYTYRLGAGAAQEYFFHFAGDTFSTVDEYVDIPLYNPELIGAVVSEIALFGNAADRDPFEIDCFILDDIPSKKGTVLFEAENMNVVDIAVKTEASVIANYEKATSNDWLAWGAYVNYTVDIVKEQLFVRARMLESSVSTSVLIVKLNLSDGTELFYPIGADSFSEVNEYSDIAIPFEAANGKIINEIVLFGNLTDKVKVEIDCFVLKESQFVSCYGSDATVLNSSAVTISEDSAIIVSDTQTDCLKFDLKDTFNNRTSQLALTAFVNNGNEGTLKIKYFDAQGGEIGSAQIITSDSFKAVGESEVILLFLQSPANPYFECDYVIIEASGKARFTVQYLTVVGNTGAGTDYGDAYCVECENLTSPVGYASVDVLNATMENGTGCLFWGMYLPRNLITVPQSKKIVVYAKIDSKPAVNVAVAQLENLVDASFFEWQIDIETDMFKEAGVYYPLEFTINSCSYPESSNEIRMWYKGYTNLSVDKILIMDADETPPPADNFVGRILKLSASKYATGDYDVVSDGVAALIGDKQGDIFSADVDFSELGTWQVKKSIVTVIKAYSLPDDENTVLAKIKLDGQTIGTVKASDFVLSDNYANLSFPVNATSGKITVEFTGEAGIKLNSVYVVRDADIKELPNYMDKLTLTPLSDTSSTAGINDGSSIIAFSDMVDSGEQIFISNYFANIQGTTLDKLTPNAKKAVLYIKILNKSGKASPVVTLDILGTAFRKNIYESDFAEEDTYYELEFVVDSAAPIGENNNFRLVYGGSGDIEIQKLIIMDKNATAPKAENVVEQEPVRPSGVEVVERASIQISQGLYDISKDALSVDTASINNGIISFSTLQHMPSTVKLISGVYLKNGDCELRSTIQQVRSNKRGTDAVLDVIIYESSNGKLKAVNGKSIKVSDFNNQLNEPICFSIPFVADERCEYTFTYSWKGNTDISVLSNDFVRKGDEQSSGREFTLPVSNGKIVVDEVPEGFTAGDKITFNGDGISATLPSSVVFDLLGRYDSFEVCVGEPDSALSSVLQEKSQALKSIKQITKKISFSVNGLVGINSTPINKLSNAVELAVDASQIKPIQAAAIYTLNSKNALFDANAVVVDGKLTFSTDKQVSGIVFENLYYNWEPQKIYLYKNASSDSQNNNPSNTEGTTGETTIITTITKDPVLDFAAFKEAVDSESGDTLKLLIKQGDVLTEEMQSYAIEKNKKLSMVVTDENGETLMMWNFGAFDKTYGDIELSVNFDEASEFIPDGAKDWLCVSTAYKGDLPKGTVLIFANRNSYTKQDILQLFAVTGKNGEKVESGISFTKDGAYIGFATDKAGEYVFARYESLKKSDSSDSSNVNYILLSVIGISALVILCGLIVFIVLLAKKRRKKNAQN